MSLDKLDFELPKSIMRFNAEGSAYLCRPELDPQFIAEKLKAACQAIDEINEKLNLTKESSISLLFEITEDIKKKLSDIILSQFIELSEEVDSFDGRIRFLEERNKKLREQNELLKKEIEELKNK